MYAKHCDKYDFAGNSSIAIVHLLLPEKGDSAPVSYNEYLE